MPTRPRPHSRGHTTDHHRMVAWEKGERIWSDLLSDDELHRLEELVSGFQVNQYVTLEFVAFQVTEAVWSFKELRQRGAHNLRKASTRRKGAVHFKEVQSLAEALLDRLRSEDFKLYNQLYLSRGYPLDDELMLGGYLEELQSAGGIPQNDNRWLPVNLSRSIDSLCIIKDLAIDAENALSEKGKRTPDALERWFAQNLASVWETFGTASIAPRRDTSKGWPFLDFLREAGQIADPDFNGTGAAEWVYDNSRNLPILDLNKVS